MRFLVNVPLINFFGDMIVGLVLVQNLPEYTDSHIQHHDSKIFTTRLDDDAAFLYKLGFRPGVPVKRLWRTLFITLLSPYFHFAFLKARIQSSLITSNFRVKILVVCWICVATWGLFVSWQIIVFVVFIPWFILYHISALLQFLTEHAWMISENPPTSRQEYANRCWGRFCGTTLHMRPAKILGFLDFFIWLLKMVVFHLPYRYGCLVGDLPAHDWHHLLAFVSRSSKKWPESIYMRQKAIDENQSLGMEDREIWGLGSALSHVFRLLSNAS